MAENFRYRFCCCTGLYISETVNAIPNIDYENIEIPILPNEFNKTLLDNTNCIRAMQNYFTKPFAQLNIKAVTHLFKVTFISICIYLNINPKQVQEWVGHSNIAMTLDTYAKLLKHDGTTLILEYIKSLKK